MRVLEFLALAGLASALSTTANAQFSVSGGGSPIPTAGTGGGGIWTSTQPPSHGVATAVVPVPVTNIDSVVIDGFSHTWIGDLQAVLVDPAGVGHTIFVRPGVDVGGSTVGNSGDFLGGSYTFIESGAPNDLPDDNTAVNPPAGTYNQDFFTGATTWPSGTSSIFNTPLSLITGPSGTWELRIYDWAGADIGGFTGWTLNGNGGGGANTGASDCDCVIGGPCGNSSGAGRGCPNSNGNGLGAELIGSGNADTILANDTFSFAVTDAAPGKPGLILSGDSSAGPAGIFVPNSAGVLCNTGPNAARGFVVVTGGTGAASFPDFQGAPYGQHANAVSGVPRSYTFWFRDPGTATGCVGADGIASNDFNFSNGWTVMWL
jgi:hypothetical protein